MNIKFRMAKLNHNLKKSSMMKELLMTFIATTLSIVLTFGTAHYLDQKAKKDLGRQTAMMVIHDMDNTVKLLKELAKEEENENNTARYIIDHLDMIDSLEYDSICKVLQYISPFSDADKLYKFDDSSEKVFLSSQDSWKNIDNAGFIDAVHDFYTTRHAAFDLFNNSPYWRKPISSETYYRYLLEYVGKSLNVYEMAKTHMMNKEVLYYYENSSYRQRQFVAYAQAMESYSNLCKFTMGITDEELDEYVKNRERVGRNVKERELIGVWTMQLLDGSSYELTFNDDHTFHYTILNRLTHHTYVGYLDISSKATGKWELKGDSLFTIDNPDLKYTIGKDKIKPIAGRETDFDEYIKQLEESIQNHLKNYNKKNNFREAYAATINNTGNKIELLGKDLGGDDDDDEEEEEQAIYLSRKK